nr:hypothetical protein [Tanacetum cinerariifolium]GEX19996.1 hypothetical protein [Tanacetum cinerariifolium]
MKVPSWSWYVGNGMSIMLTGDTLAPTFSFQMRRKATANFNALFDIPFSLWTLRTSNQQKKYRIDIIGYVTTVGKFAQPSQLYLWSCSSTLILDNDEIHAIVELKAKISDVDETEPSLLVEHGTIKELLALARSYYPACAGEKCKKGVTRNEGKLWCDQTVNYPKPRLEVDVQDDSTHTVVVMWDEMAIELTNSSAKALLDGLDEHVFEVKSKTYYNYKEFKGFTCSNIFPTHTSTISKLREVGKASNVYTLDDDDEIYKPSMKRLLTGPKMCTPSKSSEPKKEKEPSCTTGCMEIKKGESVHQYAS